MDKLFAFSVFGMVSTNLERLYIYGVEAMMAAKYIH